MAGEAKTSQFILSTATVMMGPQEDLFDLNPDAHSIGLVKNFRITAEVGYVDLTQGVKNDLVYSVANSSNVTSSMEVYEYTSKNLAYALGIDGSTYTETDTVALTNAQVAAESSTVDIAAASDISNNYPAGSFIQIQDTTKPDQVHIAEIDSASFDTDTVTLTIKTGFDTPTGVVFPVGSKVSKLNMIPLGEKTAQPFLAAKVVGILPENNKPMTLLLPKVRVTRGFDLAFTPDNFANMPFEFSLFDLVSTDPNYGTFGSRKAFLAKPTD